MGFCTKRRVYLLFLAVIVLQIVTTGVRQIFDFMGPLYALIFTNFLNIVFGIFGFFGGYTRRKHYLISYVVWSFAWCAWNVLIVCLYLPVSTLQSYKSSILSLGTGGFSWWETRFPFWIPTCVPDWASETQLLVKNCSFDPRVVECLQAGVQVYLALVGIITAISIIICPYHDEDKDNISKNGDTASKLGGSSGSFYSLSRNGTVNSRTRQRAALNLPSTSANDGQNGEISATNNIGTMDDRVRPMTPRRVKRRSARSIQSQKFGPQNVLPSTDSGRGSAGPSGSARNSLRSNSSSRRSNMRNSKKKINHFVSPVNRLMQQVVDSETSHDDPHISRYPMMSKFPMRDQGHVNPVYLGPQSPRNPPPPRPPSARSSYSNYHPARLPPMSGTSLSPSGNPNVFNLNQNIFTNPAFDTSTEYNNSQLSNNTNNTFYEDEVHFHPGHHHSSSSRNDHHHHMPPPPSHPMTSRQNPLNPNNFHFHQNNLMKAEVRSSTNHNIQEPSSSNQILAYPLAHSPVSQESFPMWGVSGPALAQAQVPTQNSNAHQKQYHNLNSIHQPIPTNRMSYSSNSHHQQQQKQQQPINSETVI